MKKLFKLTFFRFLIVIFILIQLACPDLPKETPKRDTSISLEVLSTFTTTARLQISVEDTTAEWTFGLTRNGEDVLTATVYSSDTTFTDGGLNPGTQYTYQAQWLEDGIAVDSSLNAIAQTMDTTIHNFIWEIDTLGEYGSYLNDVTIIDENNIWVVGSIRTNEPDTVHNLSYTKYNAAHWDGSEWEFIKIQPQGYVQPLQCIYYFNENDIWFGQGGLPIQWNGLEYYMYTPANGEHPGQPSIESIWGTSSSNIYFAGRNGSIVHYDGSSFTRMESETNADLKDIWGVTDDETGEVIIWACGFEQLNETVILRYKENQWIRWYSNPYNEYIDLNLDKISGPVVSLWTNDADYLWAITYWGLYQVSANAPFDFIRYPDQNAWGGYINRIRGNNSNDILFAGYQSSVWHYNGSSLSKMDGLTGDMAIYDIAMSDDIIYLCGEDYQTGRAIVIKGRRN